MIHLISTSYPTHTEGSIYLPNGKTIYTLERPWLNNQTNISCIPGGVVYVVQRDHTGRHQWFSVLDVEGRTFIEMHEANRVEQLLGCIAPCMSISEGVAHNCGNALSELVKLYGEASFALNVHARVLA